MKHVHFAFWTTLSLYALITMKNIILKLFLYLWMHYGNQNLQQKFT